MIRLITRFFDDIHRIANCMTGVDPRPTRIVAIVSLSQEDRLLLSTPRKRKPRVKSGDAA